MRGAQGDRHCASAASELGFGREGECALERFFMAKIGLEVRKWYNKDGMLDW